MPPMPPMPPVSTTPAPLAPMPMPSLPPMPPMSTTLAPPAPMPPMPPTPVSTTPKGSSDVVLASCSFEASEKSFERCFCAGSGTRVCQARDDDFDWTVKTGGSTPSKGTGPDDAADGSTYLFIEASAPRKKGDKAVLHVHVPGNATQLGFQYHMLGNTMGLLEVRDFYKQDTVLQSFDGEQGSTWQRTVVDVRGLRGVDIVGVRGSSWSSDIAVDDIKFYGPA